jgi:hypothetical protein
MMWSTLLFSIRERRRVLRQLVRPAGFNIWSIVLAPTFPLSGYLQHPSSRDTFSGLLGVLAGSS